jgi:hypothetical protein
MHIEPGVVDGAKMVLSVVTSAVACGLTIKACLETRKSSGTAALVQRSVIATAQYKSSIRIVSVQGRETCLN